MVIGFSEGSRSLKRAHRRRVFFDLCLVKIDEEGDVHSQGLPAHRRPIIDGRSRPALPDG
jgi:hypothetical protein